MKIMLTTAAILALSATTPFAQNQPAQQSQGQAQSQQDGGNFPSVQPPPPPSLDNQQQQVSGSQRPGGDRMMGHHRGWHGGRTASISVEAAGAKVKVRCGADQSSDECVEMVGRLLDQVQQSANEGDRSDRDRYSRRDSRWDDRDRDRYGDRDRRWRE
ncbi:hypothetical protein ABID21_003960 [Pseudorhizobium tarimense]|uniref:Uncharacterized protein n=1 Tax=Pseudorhizobium tarimense TaxID=1079109 RepID=A0ABV2HBI4_9HYPH|nr:hypothetical protein [Pseudorhizobium tarimense]MCJ8520740.1 hypothetical protein [Pseudorhizobium tarimense]